MTVVPMNAAIHPGRIPAANQEYRTDDGEDRHGFGRASAAYHEKEGQPCGESTGRCSHSSNDLSSLLKVWCIGFTNA
jgi:hypothetical protein